MDKNIGTDDIPMDYQLLTRNNNMDIMINELSNSPNGTDESNEAINKIVVKHPIINPVESFYEISRNKNFDAANLSQNIDFSISIGRNDESHVENKTGSQINLDKMNKPPFNEVSDNAINQLIELIENTKSLQSKHKELLLTSKNEEPM